MSWGFFRVAGDLSHITAKCVLLFSIHRNKSAEGVSLLTQILYLLVFVARYTDLFQESYAWNYFFKVFYLLSSFYTIAVMRFVFPRTREREVAWKLSAVILAACLVLSPLTMWLLEARGQWGFLECLWVFSQMLESVAVLPQLLLLRQTTIPTVITSFYIVLLGSYRALYLVNWFLRELDTNGKPPNKVSIIFGLVQTALYLDFGWVYWSRQRVKLRNGGIVDADDLRRGWLLRRIFGSKQFAHVDNADADADGNDEESAPALGGSRTHNGGAGARPKWGSRGISISADEGVLEQQQQHERGRPLEDVGDDNDHEEHGLTDVVDPDAKMRDPDELARALDEDDEADVTHTDPRGQPSGVRGGPSGVRGGEEWNED